MDNNYPYWVHIHLDGELLAKRIMRHVPRVGDTARWGGDEPRFARVTEVIWCWDENSDMGDRVNLRLSSDAPIPEVRE